jgi:glycosyltransferase involved in cell wall biosynthesis
MISSIVAAPDNTPDSHTAPDGSGASFRLCQVHLSPDDPAQTFARDHAERLPCHVSVVHGGRNRPGGAGARPLFLDDDPLRSESLAARIVRHARAQVWILQGRNVERELDAEAYLEAFRRARPDAVLVEFGNVAVDVMDACTRLRLPLIVHFHGFDVHSRGVLERHGDRYPALFEKAAALIGVSRPMCDALEALGAPPGKVHHLPNGVDAERFSGAAPDRAEPVFLAVGRFVEKKAPQLTIAAFASLHSRRTGAQLRMIGSGDLLNACEDLAVGLGLREAVSFLGAQPHDVVAEEMQRARAFVQHSIVAADGDSEGMPVAILEACASGVPVVSTRHAGIPEVVVDGETGFLVAERDVEAMASRMEQLVDDPALAASLGRAGRARIAEHFTMDETVAGLWKIIREATATARGEPPPAAPNPAR